MSTKGNRKICRMTTGAGSPHPRAPTIGWSLPRERRTHAGAITSPPTRPRAGSSPRRTTIRSTASQRMTVTVHVPSDSLPAKTPWVSPDRRGRSGRARGCRRRRRAIPPSPAGPSPTRAAQESSPRDGRRGDHPAVAGRCPGRKPAPATRFACSTPPLGPPPRATAVLGQGDLIAGDRRLLHLAEVRRAELLDLFRLDQVHRRRLLADGRIDADLLVPAFLGALVQHGDAESRAALGTRAGPPLEAGRTVQVMPVGTEKFDLPFFGRRRLGRGRGSARARIAQFRLGNVGI